MTLPRAPQPQPQPQPSPVAASPAATVAPSVGARSATPAGDWQRIHIEALAPSKPAFGASCNGCGVCCLSAPCPLGMLLSRRRSGACTALRWDAVAHQYRCGAITATESVLPSRVRWTAPLLRRLARRWIAAGIGCDSTLLATPDVESPEPEPVLVGAVAPPTPVP